MPSTVESAGATVSTGATSELPIILLEAKTLLTETITIAAIAAKTNFFIILSFKLLLLILLFTFVVDSLSNPLFIITRCVPEMSKSTISADYQPLIIFVSKTESGDNGE